MMRATCCAVLIYSLWSFPEATTRVGAAIAALVLVCAACGMPLELEQYVCDACGASAEIGTLGREWRDVPLAGTVHTATLVHRREPGLIVATGPYPVIDIELASGHRLVLTTDDHRGMMAMTLDTTISTESKHEDM